MIADFASMLVYLVEPSSVQASLIRHMLSEQGVLNVTHFESAAPMLAQAKVAPPALVISALYLADMQGTELVQRLRADPATTDTPFILVSSETRPQVLEPVRQSGVCGILPKPFSQAQLDKALRATMDYLDPETLAEFDEADLAAIKVLMVDDSDSARHFMRHTLENMGIVNIVEAKDGSEAVVLLAESSFDLVITDYNMPEMDGKALIEFIRTRSWQSTIPVLMVTSESNYGRLAAIEEAGVSGICDKPFEPATVRALLTRILKTGE